jgi:hypothetical protein
MTWSFLTGEISWQAFTTFMFVAIGLGILLSASGMLLEEMSFHIYPRGRQLLALAGVVLVENLGYRQLNTWWRLVGLYRWATQKEASWGTMKRKGTWQSGASK